MYPSPQRSKVGEFSGLRESPFDKCLRESLSEVDKGLWETPNQTTDSEQDKKSRFNKVRLKAQLYRVYRVYIGKSPKQGGPCVRHIRQ